MNEAYIHRRSLVFIGAPRGGKTCLMAAWLDYLRAQESIKNLSVTEVGHEGEARISEVWRRIAESNQEPDQTAVGLFPANEIHFSYHKRKFVFEFHDFSGETATKAFTGQLDDETICAEVVMTCEQADLLFLVVNLEDYRNQTSNPLQELLVFLNEVAGHSTLGTKFTHSAVIYLSHPDRLIEEELEKFRTEIFGRVRQASPNLPEAAIIHGASVAREGKEGLRFATKDDAFSPHRHFAAWFADLVSTGGSAGNALGHLGKLWRSPGFKAVTLLLALTLISGTILWQRHQKKTAREAWDQHIAAFVAFEDKITDGAPGMDWTALSRLLEEVRLWDKQAQTTHIDHYRSDNFDARVARTETAINERLRSLVQGIDKIETVLADHYRTHRTNYERLYPAILQSARTALAKPQEWNSESLNEWRTVQRFIEAMEKGVFIEFTSLSFWFNKYWNMQPELHIFQVGHTPPYGDRPSPKGSVFGIQWPVKNDPVKGAGKYRFFWQGDEMPKSNRKLIPARDQLYLVVYGIGSIGSPGTVREIDFRLEPAGIHYFGKLDAEFSMDGETKTTFQFNLTAYRLYDEDEKLIQIPEVVRRASR